MSVVWDGCLAEPILWRQDELVFVMQEDRAMWLPPSTFWPLFRGAADVGKYLHQSWSREETRCNLCLRGSKAYARSDHHQLNDATPEASLPLFHETLITNLQIFLFVFKWTLRHIAPVLCGGCNAFLRPPPTQTSKVWIVYNLRCNRPGIVFAEHLSSGY